MSSKTRPKTTIKKVVKKSTKLGSPKLNIKSGISNFLAAKSYGAISLGGSKTGVHKRRRIVPKNVNKWLNKTVRKEKALKKALRKLVRRSGMMSLQKKPMKRKVRRMI